MTLQSQYESGSLPLSSVSPVSFLTGFVAPRGRERSPFSRADALPVPPSGGVACSDDCEERLDVAGVAASLVLPLLAALTSGSASAAGMACDSKTLADVLHFRR